VAVGIGVPVVEVAVAAGVLDGPAVLLRVAVGVASPLVFVAEGPVVAVRDGGGPVSVGSLVAVRVGGRPVLVGAMPVAVGGATRVTVAVGRGGEVLVDVETGVGTPTAA